VSPLLPHRIIGVEKVELNEAEYKRETSVLEDSENGSSIFLIDEVIED
jgi:hypothetical protein